MSSAASDVAVCGRHFERTRKLNIQLGPQLAEKRMADSQRERSATVTAQEFLKISTQLFNDLRVWIAEASKDDALSASDLAMLNAAMKIVERVTLAETEAKPDTSN